jgi:hypothetical protein
VAIGAEAITEEAVTEATTKDGVVTAATTEDGVVIAVGTVE